MDEGCIDNGKSGSDLLAEPPGPADRSRRLFLQAAGLLIAGRIFPDQQASHSLAADNLPAEVSADHKIVLVIIGGVRRAETFSPDGLVNIPHLSGDLLPSSLFYPHVRNEGVTAHFNAISSILTGNWQRVDDWGKLAPASPTLFEQFRKGRSVDRSDTWIIASNKALTSQIGASSDPRYGPAFGANVVFPKQLMLAAVVEALRAGRTANLADREKVEAELENAMQGSNYEGLGWNVFDASEQLDPDVRTMVAAAVSGFVHAGGPTSGDELTFFVSREVMRRFGPRLLVVVLSDVEAAHFGSYAMHLSGIRSADRLSWQLWEEIQAIPSYRGKTTMIVLPEFGRDPDGSTTNGFFNHRANHDSTRDTWMMALGPATDKPQIVERPIYHVDLCPTLAGLLGCPGLDAQGSVLREFRG